jgi:hypothetical protein
MSTRRRGSSGRGRLIWGGLVLVLLAALASTFFLSRGAVSAAEDEAEARAVDWAGAVLFDALSPEQMQAPISDAEYRRLLLTVQSGILSDDRAVRIRVWSMDRTLVLSTDQLDAVGEVVAQDDPQIAAALGGQTLSTVTPTRVAPAEGLGGSDEKLYETSVPLRLPGAPGISGVVQIDQRYSSIESEAAGPWRTVRIGLVLVLTAAGVMLVLSLRPRPAPIGSPEGSGEETPAVSGRERRALERAGKAGKGVRAAEKGVRAAEKGARAAEEPAARAEPAVTEAPATDDTEERVRELEERATRAEARAAVAEERLREAAERASGGEPVRRGVPGVGAVATAEADMRVVTELRQAVAELDELKLKLSFADASLKEAEARLAERENAAMQIEQAWRAAGQELEDARAALADREVELRNAQDAAQAGRPSRDGPEGVEGTHGVEERVAAAEQRADAEARRAAALEAKVQEVEGELAQILTGAEAMATELEDWRNGARAGAATVSASGQLPVASQGEVAALMARVAELESQRRADVSELQRAQEALANTQLDATQARRRAKELEERLRELGSGAEEGSVAPAALQEEFAGYAEIPVVPTRAIREPAAPTPYAKEPVPEPTAEPAGSIAARLASIVRDREAGRTPQEGTAEDSWSAALGSEDVAEEVTQDDTGSAAESDGAVEEEGLSLRERLARAAAARHRAPGTAGSESD